MNDEIPSEVISRPTVIKRDKTEFRRCPPDRHRVRLHLSYDGTEFHGWQRQTDSAGNTTLVTGQGTIEAAVKQIFGEKLAVVGASRTDAGVHAQMQVAHFDCKRDPRTFKDLRYSLQSLTPETLVIKEVFMAPPDFHSIATSIDKTYRYSILNRRVPSALRHRTSWWIREPLDLDLLNEASNYLIGTHDFKSFQTSGTYVETTTRTLKKAFWRRTRPGEAGGIASTAELANPISNQMIADESEILKSNRLAAEMNDTLVFEIQGEGFLKQMVRNIVGTLVDLQVARRPAKDIKTILEALDRRKAGNTAAPQGLFLTEVRYPVELDNRCRAL